MSGVLKNNMIRKAIIVVLTLAEPPPPSPSSVVRCGVGRDIGRACASDAATISKAACVRSVGRRHDKVGLAKATYFQVDRALVLSHDAGILGLERHVHGILRASK